MGWSRPNRTKCAKDARAGGLIGIVSDYFFFGCIDLSSFFLRGEMISLSDLTFLGPINPSDFERSLGLINPSDFEGSLGLVNPLLNFAMIYYLFEFS